MSKSPPRRVGAGPIEQTECRRVRKAGTCLANYRDTHSCALSVQAVTWGGARNRADRTSDMLSDAQVKDIRRAAAVAFATGRTFQRHWIIHYGSAGIEPRDGARFVSHILDMVGKQARRDGGELTALWVRECASDKGEHVHILLCLPAGLSASDVDGRKTLAGRRA